MFTGIVQAVGRITAIEKNNADCSIYFDCAELAGENIEIGDSIAVNGCCLTIVQCSNELLKVDVSAETLMRTAIKNYQTGTRLNLELAMQAQTRFGGHIVTGHIDCLAELVLLEPQGRSTQFDFVIQDYGRYIAEKGSVTVDGVSLTVNEVEDEDELTRFSVNIIPHTLEATTFAEYALGTTVNVEVDLIARYLERLNQAKT